MKVSKLIKELKYWKKIYGDREVNIQDMTPGNMRIIKFSGLCASVRGEDEDDDVSITLLSHEVEGELTIEGAKV